MHPDKQSAYLFEDKSWNAMKSFIDRKTLFAFDLDGTLAPIVSNPGTIGIPDSVRKEITILNEQAVVAVITGRSRSDAMQYMPITPHYLIGNHGAEGLPGWEKREREFSRTAIKWQKQLELILSSSDANGISIENKGATLSIHYRQAGNTKTAHSLILSAVNQLIPQPRRISGKYIENLIPEGAPDKGIALMLLMSHAKRQKAFFAGDDETDEDVFRLRDKDIFSVRVGRKTGSQAQFHLRSQREIVRLLRMINGIFTNIEVY
jgi:trehalose 6-phosphate phosphatase